MTPCRSLLAHADSVMGLRFVPGTHCFFTCSKDKTLKYWDADHFEHVLTLPGHQAEVWGLAMASDGSYLASCGHDRSIRTWERTDDQVFLDEEREKALDSMFEAELDRPAAPTSTTGEEGERKRRIGLEMAGVQVRRRLPRPLLFTCFGFVSLLLDLVLDGWRMSVS